MSVQQAEAFVARVQQDPDFADRLVALREDPAAVQALVAAEGFDATPEEIREVFLETFAGELSEEQLAAIAGGASGVDVLVGLATGFMTVGAIGVPFLAAAAGV